MKLFIKIGLITLLFLLKYQSAGADAISIYEASCMQESETAVTATTSTSATDQGLFDNYTFTNNCITGHQQVLAKLMPEDLRIRRAEELQQSFLKVLIGHFSSREANLAADKEKCFTSYPIHCVNPACKYFVFALRRILI